MIRTSLAISQLISAELIMTDISCPDVHVSGVLKLIVDQFSRVMCLWLFRAHNMMGTILLITAIANGAAAIIVSKKVCCDVPVIQVADTHQALQYMAIAYRRMFDINYSYNGWFR